MTAPIDLSRPNYDCEVYALGLLHMSVCTRLNDEETIARVNVTEPTGLDNGWAVSANATFSDGRTPNPAPCNMHPGTHRHLLLEC